jgi:putative toxin-antitoxin system antitoxin component (TIGR02293 family)
MANVEAKEVAEVLGGPKTVGKVRTWNDLANRVRKGLPWRSFRSVREHYQVQPEALRVVALISARTLARRKEKNLPFAPDASDRLLRLARVFAYSQRVFGDRQVAAQWFGRPNRALGGIVPLELLDTDIGVAQVRDELLRIEHGIFA